MKRLPNDLVAYKRTATFTEKSVPKALLGEHRTKKGVWGTIVVVEGQLLYRILEPEVEEVSLSPDRPGVVEPTVLHQVEPLGEVRFYVEFHR
jgi:tellurite resistance-related uncharacterized protein